MIDKPRVLVAFPVGGSCHPAFTKSLCDLVYFELTEPSEEYTIEKIEYSASLYVQENRNLLVELARDKKCEWLFMVDTDESFECNALRLLLDTAKKTKSKIVTGLYTNAQLAPQETQGGFLVVDMIYREIETGEYENIVPPTDYRPFRVDAFGSGIMLTHVSIYDNLQWPWFWLDLIQPTNKSKPQIINEDIGFCRSARLAGYELWCNPLVEAVHYKSLALLPSTFHHFLRRAQQVEKEMSQ